MSMNGDLEVVRFPRQEVTSFNLSNEQYEELAVVGVPAAVFRVFVCAPTLVAVSTPGGDLICFGHSGINGRICLDPRTGEVLQLVGAKESGTFVNTSLAHFRRTAQVVVGRFPFHASGAELEEREQGASEIAAEIMKIDPPAMEPDQLWSTLIDDICIGDFDEEVNALLDSAKT